MECKNNTDLNESDLQCQDHKTIHYENESSVIIESPLCNSKICTVASCFTASMYVRLQQMKIFKTFRNISQTVQINSVKPNVAQTTKTPPSFNGLQKTEKI